LRRLVSESPSEEVKKEAKGALWILEDKTPSEEDDKEKNAGKVLLRENAPFPICNHSINCER